MKKIFFPILFVGLVFLAGCGHQAATNNAAVSGADGTMPAANEMAAITPSSLAAESGMKVLSIIPEQSKAQYSMNELLRGTPTLVVGSTSQLAGEIGVKTDRPAAIKIGEIKLDAASFVTDIAARDKNVVELIFKANEPQNKYIVFQPTQVSGVPEILTPDQGFPVRIEGNLTISGTTRPVTFVGGITWRQDGSLVGSATTDLTYGDFGLKIPDFPFLSNVDQVVKLEIDLTAAAK
ncbi:MAG: YceI family protein [Patescibacteria group bacterium]